MAFDYTTTGLVSNIQQRITMPDSQNLWGSTQIITALNDQFFTDIIELIVRAKSDFYLAWVDYPIVQASVEGNSQSMYAIPSTAIGQRLAGVYIVDEQSGLTKQLVQLDIDKIANNIGPGQIGKVGFYLQDNSIVLFPARSFQGTLRVYYYQRPNELVDSTQFAQITSINGSTNSITVNQIPTTWTTDTTLDFQSQYQPFNIYLPDQTIVGLSNPSINLTTVAGMSVGDYLAPSGFAACPKLPQEFWRLLAQNVSVKILESLADPAIQITKQQYQEMEARLLNLITARVDRDPIVITQDGQGIFDQMYQAGRYDRPI